MRTKQYARIGKQYPKQTATDGYNAVMIATDDRSCNMPEAWEGISSAPCDQPLRERSWASVSDEERRHYLKTGSTFLDKTAKAISKL